MISATQHGPELAAAVVIVGALVLYALGGGADFGGGVWDLFASGRRAAAQREAIAHAIGPIWEANHVWLILVIVVLFVAFPSAFAAIATALHVPLSIMLVGIVLRGSAFAFRSYGGSRASEQRRWSRVFAVASLVTPLTLGMCVGAIASGGMRLDPSGRVITDFVSDWWAPFPIAIGFMTLALFAFLAAVYLTLETEDPHLQDDFRRRALAAGVALGICAGISFLLAGHGAPVVRDGLAGRGWSLPFQLATASAAVGAILALLARRYPLARMLAIVQTVLIIGGWALSQYPYLLVPDLTVVNAAAPRSVLVPLLVALAVGAVVLIPSLTYLFMVFKGTRSRP